MTLKRKKSQQSLFNISVLVPAYNSEDTIEDCLNSILKIYDKNCMEVIICDNQSNDLTLNIASKFPFKILHNKKKQTAGSTRNLAAEEAKYENLLFIDSDCIVAPNTISELHKYYKQEYLNKGCITGIFSLDNKYDNFFSQYKTIYSNHKFINFKRQALNSAIMFINKEVFFKVGMFDEDLKESEDDHLSIKLINHGYHIYLIKNLVVDHYKYFNLKSLIKNDFNKTNSLTKIFLSNLSEDKKRSNVKEFFYLYFSAIINILIIFLFILFCVSLVLKFEFNHLEFFYIIPIIFMLNNFSFFIYNIKNRTLIFSFSSLIYHFFTFFIATISSSLVVINFLFIKILSLFKF